MRLHVADEMACLGARPSVSEPLYTQAERDTRSEMDDRGCEERERIDDPMWANLGVIRRCGGGLRDLMRFRQRLRSNPAPRSPASESPFATAGWIHSLAPRASNRAPRMPSDVDDLGVMRSHRVKRIALAVTRTRRLVVFELELRDDTVDLRLRGLRRA